MFSSRFFFLTQILSAWQYGTPLEKGYFSLTLADKPFTAGANFVKNRVESNH